MTTRTTRFSAIAKVACASAILITAACAPAVRTPSNLGATVVSPIAADSPATDPIAAGSLAGRQDAERKSVLMLGIANAAGSTLSALLNDEEITRDQIPTHVALSAVTGGGVALAMYFLDSGKIPDEKAREIDARGPQYAAAYRDAFRDRYRNRALVSGLLGAAAGTLISTAIYASRVDDDGGSVIIRFTVAAPR